MAELEVHMNGQRVAVLDGSDREALRLTYDDDWIESPDATPLSVSMPLRRGVAYRHAVVHPYLWGLLPDNDLVIARWAREYRASPTNVFSLLAHVGSDVAGAAQYLTPGGVAEASEAPTWTPLDDASVGALLADVERDLTAWHGAAGGRWSLSGAQGKVALSRRDGGWGVPSGSAPTTHILKPAIRGLEDHDLNEHLCLAAAAGCGLRVAESSIEHLGGQRALVVARYDRRRRGDGELVRVHQEDFCQALSVHPALKYESEGGPTAVDLARLLRAVTPDRPDAEATRLYLAIAFNWLIGGTDAHAKNYSLLLAGTQARLAPLYDLASALPYDDHPPKLKLAQKVGGTYRLGSVGARHWVRLAEGFGIDPSTALERVRELAASVGPAMQDAVAAAELTRPERAAGRRLAGLVGSWSEACRLTL